MSEIAPRFVFVHAGKYIGAAGHADCSGVVVFIKNHSFASKLVHVWRFDILVSVTTNRQRVLIVGKQEHNVGAR